MRRSPPRRWWTELAENRLSPAQSTPTNAAEIKSFSALSKPSAVGLLLTVPRINHRGQRTQSKKDWMLGPEDTGPAVGQLASTVRKAWFERPRCSAGFPTCRFAGFQTCRAVRSSRAPWDGVRPCRQECLRNGRQECLSYDPETRHRRPGRTTQAGPIESIDGASLR